MCLKSCHCLALAAQVSNKMQTHKHINDFLIVCFRIYGAVLNNNLYLKETANFTVQADWVPLLAPLCPFNCSFRGRCISTGNCACDPGGLVHCGTGFWVLFAVLVKLHVGPNGSITDRALHQQKQWQLRPRCCVQTALGCVLLLGSACGLLPLACATSLCFNWALSVCSRQWITFLFDADMAAVLASAMRGRVWPVTPCTRVSSSQLQGQHADLQNRML